MALLFQNAFPGGCNHDELSMIAQDRETKGIDEEGKEKFVNPALSSGHSSHPATSLPSIREDRQPSTTVIKLSLLTEYMIRQELSRTIIRNAYFNSSFSNSTSQSELQLDLLKRKA